MRPRSIKVISVMRFVAVGSTRSGDICNTWSGRRLGGLIGRSKQHPCQEMITECRDVALLTICAFSPIGELKLATAAGCGAGAPQPVQSIREELL